MEKNWSTKAAIMEARQSRMLPPKIMQKPPQPKTAPRNCSHAGFAGSFLMSSRRDLASQSGSLSLEISLESWFTATTFSSLAPLIGMNSALA